MLYTKCRNCHYSRDLCVKNQTHICCFASENNNTWRKLVAHDDNCENFICSEKKQAKIIKAFINQWISNGKLSPLENEYYTLSFACNYKIDEDQDITISNPVLINQKIQKNQNEDDS